MACNQYTVELKKEDLEKLLRQHLYSDLKVKSFSTKPLTKTGDNYGSTILAVEVIYYKDENSDVYKLSIVSKLVPESPFLRKMFNVEITFNKEVRAYTLVAHEFHKLQKEKGIPDSETLDVFSKYYGSRTNRQNDINLEADDSAVLLMENLTLSGYKIRERRKGLNLKHMEFTVIKLAQFHALAIVLKLLKPQVFKDTILKTCEKFTLGIPQDHETNQKVTKNIIGYIKTISECVPYVEAVEKMIQEDMNMRKERIEALAIEPFATMVHNDFWVNNMMFKYEQYSNETNNLKNEEIPIAIKFIDFQITIYESPVRDLLFFLFTSSEDGLIDKYFDHLINLYHMKFITVLKTFDCDITPFSYKHFQEEINTIAPREFMHILYLLNPISADSENMEDISNFDKDSLVVYSGGDVYKNKVRCLIKSYGARGWLQ